MKALVLGGTGTVGSQVVRELLARGAEVRVLTRDAKKTGSLPSGVSAVVGDLLDPATVRSAFAGMDGAFLLNVVSASECQEGLMAVNGARLAGVRRIAHLSVHLVDQAPHLPHFGAKIAVEIALKASGFSGGILRANNFFQNDYWYRDVLLQHGVYPQPIGGTGVSRVDVRDIAEAAAIVLTGSAGGFETYDLVGPEAVTGASTAAAWSAALGRPVVYGGEDMDAWEKMAGAMGPSYLAFDFRLMYEHFQKHGLKADAAAVDRLTKLLGHAPRSFEAFTKETAAAWKS